MSTKDAESPYNFFYYSEDVPQQMTVRLESIVGVVPAQLRRAWLRRQLAAADERYWKASSDSSFGRDEGDDDETRTHRDGSGGDEREHEEGLDEISAENYVDVLKLVAQEVDDDHDDEIDSPELFLECQLWAGGLPLTLPKRTGVSEILPDVDALNSERSRTSTAACGIPPLVEWEDWVEFPIKLRDLPIDTTVSLKLLDNKFCDGKLQQSLIASTTVRMYNEQGELLTGKQKLHLTIAEEKDDEEEAIHPSSTELEFGKVVESERVRRAQEFGHLECLVEKYDRGEIPRVPWLDRLTFREINRQTQMLWRSYIRENPGLYLYAEFPVFNYPVVYKEISSQAPFLLPMNTDRKMKNTGGQFLSRNKSLPFVFPDQIAIDSALPLEFTSVLDLELDKESPAEYKQLKLARSINREVVDKELKPNASEKRQIQIILRYPPNRELGSDEKQLFWKYRYFLKSDKRALTKFLRCVDWSDALEVRESTALMQSWEPVGPQDALELLSPDFAHNEEVREYAVKVLETATDDEIMSYLLQLVQALRYESRDDSSLAEFLIRRAVANYELANHFHWYLTASWDDKKFSKRFSEVHSRFQNAQMQADSANLNPQQRVMESIEGQNQLVDQLCALAREIRSYRGSRQKKIERLRSCLSKTGKGELVPLSCSLPLPCDPHIILKGVKPEMCNIFKSALTPLRISFDVTSRTPIDHRGNNNEEDKSANISTGIFTKTIIFKSGDDLRQDQLVVQMITLMDKLLKAENLDLRLTPYKVLATSTEDGMLEFIPSTPLSNVLAENKTITKFLAAANPDSNGPYGMESSVLDTFVKSCAGYCVITYILGVGDRHLDNLLLTKDGRLFHVDYGYILGKDPKPFPPPMKLCKEMVEGMGGAESQWYTKFKSYCCEAYNILRKAANLILNLFTLMAGANIPDLTVDTEKALLKLLEKFRLDLSDEAAVQHFQTLINESVRALFPQITETIHRWAQYWR